MPLEELDNSMMASVHRSRDITNAIQQAVLEGTQVFNVHKYGAIGDGVTNDAAAIQAAINALNGKAGIVFFPAKNYYLGTTSLIANGPFILQGSGISTQGALVGTRLIYEGTGAAIVINNGTGTTTHGFRVSDITIDGNSLGYYGIKVGASSGSPLSASGTFDNLYLTKCVTAGLWLVSSQLSEYSKIYADYNTGAGILIDNVSGGANTANTFISCYGRYNGTNGLKIVRALAAHHFLNCVFEQNQQEGVYMSAAGNCNDLSFLGLHLEYNNLGAGRDTSAYYQVYLSSATFWVGNLSIRDVYIVCGNDNKGMYVKNNWPYRTIVENAAVYSGVTSSEVTPPTPKHYGNLDGNGFFYLVCARESSYWTVGASLGSMFVSVLGIELNAGGAGGIPGNRIAAHFTGTATWNPGSLIDGATTTTTVTVTAAAVGNQVTVGFPLLVSASPAAAGFQVSGQVTAANTVTVTLTNHTGSTVDLDSGTLSASVWA